MLLKFKRVACAQIDYNPIRVLRSQEKPKIAAWLTGKLRRSSKNLIIFKPRTPKPSSHSQTTSAGL